MATMVYANRLKLETLKGLVHYDSDAIRGVLMESGYSFDKDNHGVFADVSANELAAGFGYTAGGILVSNPVLAQDNANDWATCVVDDLVWTAAGGSIGPTPGVLFYDDTHPNDVIIGFAAYASELTAPDGVDLTLTSITLARQT